MKYYKYDPITGEITKIVDVFGNQFNDLDFHLVPNSITNSFNKDKYKINLSTKELEIRSDWPPIGYIEIPPDSGNLVKMTPQEKVSAGIETIDQYRNSVIQSIVDEMNKYEKPLLEKYSNGQQLSFSTRKKESSEWLAIPAIDRTVALAQTNFSLLYHIVTIENGIVNPTTDDITNEANSIKKKVITFEQTLTSLSNKKGVLIGKPEILDANNVVIQSATGVYALTVDELLSYDITVVWNSI